jgi:hypothetical protein
MIDRIQVSHVELKVGDSVVLRPKAGGDVMDFVLAGRRATICSFEEDFEGRVYIAVTVDDDPGRDLGQMAQTGHRFFYAPNEVEPCDPRS